MALQLRTRWQIFSTTGITAVLQGDGLPDRGYSNIKTVNARTTRSMGMNSKADVLLNVNHDSTKDFHKKIYSEF